MPTNSSFNPKFQPASIKSTLSPAAKPFVVVEDPVLTPAEVLEHIRVPKEQIQIKGFVSRITWGKNKVKVYGDLQYGGGIIGFEISADQLPENTLPAIGAPVILKGTLSLRLNTFFTDYKYQLHLTGELVGEFTPYTPEEPVELDKHTVSKKLSRWFLTESICKPTLLVLCSETAEQDMKKVLEHADTDVSQFVEVVYARIKFHPVEATVANIYEHTSNYEPHMILIARGGGSASEIAVAANSPKVVEAILDAGIPYYSAIGHESDVTLLDKFADESFHTPTDAAHQLAGHALDLEMDYAEEDHKIQVEKERAKAIDEAEMLKKSLGKTKMWFALTAAALIAIVGLNYLGVS